MSDVFDLLCISFDETENDLKIKDREPKMFNEDIISL